jgi:CRP/FNR family transcriptional activator FtrB
MVMRRLGFPSLRSLSLFRDIDSAILKELLRAARLKRFQKQETVIKEGEIPSFFHIVVDGTVELFATHNDKKTTIDIVKAIAPIEVAAVIRDAVYLNSVRTLASSQILMIPAQSVRHVYDRHAAFSRAIATELAERCRDSLCTFKNKALRPSAERLANWILQTSVALGNQQRLELFCDKRTLASCLGMTPENFSRNMARLAKYGVRNSGRDIVIENAFALTEFAKPNTLIDGRRPFHSNSRRV